MDGRKNIHDTIKKEISLNPSKYKDEENNIATREVREAVAQKLNINKDEVIIEKKMTRIIVI